MAQSDPSCNDPAAGDTASPRTTPAHSNGESAAAGSPGGTASNTTAANGASSATDPSRTQRAEELVDRLAERAGQLTATWGRKLARFAARVREEAQDIWAEAQSIRRGDQP